LCLLTIIIRSTYISEALALNTKLGFLLFLLWTIHLIGCFLSYTLLVLVGLELWQCPILQHQISLISIAFSSISKKLEIFPLLKPFTHVTEIHPGWRRLGVMCLFMNERNLTFSFYIESTFHFVSFSHFKGQISNIDNTQVTSNFLIIFRHFMRIAS
jgi:hypothetical protein